MEEARTWLQANQEEMLNEFNYILFKEKYFVQKLLTIALLNDILLKDFTKLWWM